MEGDFLQRYGITHAVLEKAMSEVWFELEKAEEMINLAK
jgi:hypothetical protein